MDGDLQYNIDMMKKNNVKKGCLYRSSSHYLCSCWNRVWWIDARDGKYYSNPYDSSNDAALKTFNNMKKLF